MQSSIVHTDVSKNFHSNIQICIGFARFPVKLFLLLRCCVCARECVPRARMRACARVLRSYSKTIVGLLLEIAWTSDTTTIRLKMCCTLINKLFENRRTFQNLGHMNINFSDTFTERERNVSIWNGNTRTKKRKQQQNNKTSKKSYINERRSSNDKMVLRNNNIKR